MRPRRFGVAKLYVSMIVGMAVNKPHVARTMFINENLRRLQEAIDQETRMAIFRRTAQELKTEGKEE